MAQAGKLDETVAAYRQKLAIERDVLGGLHEDVVGSLNYLSYLRELGGDFAAARDALTEMVAIRERQPERQDWQIGDARRALADLDHRAAMTPDRRHRLQQADRLNGLSEALYAQGRYGEGIGPCRKAMEIRGELLGAGHPHYAESLNNLAALYKAMGDYARAVPMYCEALAIRKKALGANHPHYAGSLSNLAVLYVDMGDYARAEPMYREVLAVRKQALGANHPHYASSLDGLAVLHQAMGDYVSAEPMLREALAVRKKALGVNHPEYALSLNNLALLYWATGDYVRAGPIYREAMAITKKALGANHPDYARSLNNLAALYRSMGDYARAEPMLQEALAIEKKAVGANHPEYALSLNNLAELYRDMGDYARAEPMYREALAIDKKAVGTDHPHYAQFLNNLAVLYEAMGDNARAEPMFVEALAIRKRASGTDHPDYARSLNNLATLYWSMGDYARAETTYREALAIRKKALGANHPDYARSLTSLAALYGAMGDYARAETMYREGVKLTKQAVGADHPDYAWLLDNQAALYRDMGDYARAEPMYREALAIRKKTLGTNHPRYAASLSNLAGLYHATGDSAHAEPLLREALAITSRFTQGASSVLGERQRLQLHQGQRVALDGYLSVSRSGGHRPADLYDQVLDWKGAAEAGRAERRLARDQPELAPTVAQLAQVRAELANLAFRSPRAKQAETWRQQLHTLREVKEDLEADLACRSDDYRGQKQAERLGPDGVTAALPTDTALVDLLEYHHFSPPKGGKGPLQRERRLLAFILRSGRPVALVPLGEARTIDESVASWRRALVARQASALQAAAAELGRRVLEPMRPRLGDVRTILIAPDGVLSFFPFAALPGSKPGSYLIEDLAIGYVASGRHAVEALADPNGPAGRGLLAVGDVDFQADPGQPGPSGQPPTRTPLITQRGGFRPLPGTGPEARRARVLFQAAFAGQPAELLTRAQPTEAAIKRRLDGGHWRVVHLGTHGFFESPARVAALRAAVRREDQSVPSLKASRPGEDDPDFDLTPLLYSGVVLAGGGLDAGAGLPDPSAEASTREDGILTAEEVQSLDLRGTEVVVLSACETGVGHGFYGQGLLGLQRAFQAAGARSVVASLWKVDDAATSVLMEQFYTNLWVKKMPKLEALRRAQITVLKNPGLVRARQAELANRGIGEKAEKLPRGGKVSALGAGAPRSDPSLWAAFVMSGDWR
jgi:CHAT domain-containing protein/Tfp pilus assembly protein PilF